MLIKEYILCGRLTLTTVSWSQGRMVHRSITSQLTFIFCCASSATSLSTCTCVPQPTSVTSVPAAHTRSGVRLTSSRSNKFKVKYAGEWERQMSYWLQMGKNPEYFYIFFFICVLWAIPFGGNLIIGHEVMFTSSRWYQAGKQMAETDVRLASNGNKSWIFFKVLSIFNLKGPQVTNKQWKTEKVENWKKLKNKMSTQKSRFYSRN